MRGGTVRGVPDSAPATQADVLIAADAGSITLSGAVSIDRLQLPSGVGEIIIPFPGLSGNVYNMDLRGADADIEKVIFEEWQDRQILKAASGYTLQTSDVGSFRLRNFISGDYSRIQRIDITHELDDTGKLIGSESDFFTKIMIFAFGD
jgi:hypothetical protein